MSSPTKEKELQEGKFFAVISYISFLCIVSLALKKDNKFALHHAKQGLVLFVFEVVSFILSIIPLFGWLLKVLGSAFFVFMSLWGIWSAFKGRYKQLPIISEVAHKIII